ncbi:MAG: ABC transporter ATPase [Bacteroidetes bacterium]|nr:ABC transporter ATPase [Bacteroidota bacterium]
MNERIWIYTLSKPLADTQWNEFKNMCQGFVSHWTAHDVSLDASYELKHDRFLIIKVNEQKYNASGCSIDKQLRFVKQLEEQFGIELLNRLLVAYLDAEGAVKVAPQTEIRALLANNSIHPETIVYNNTIIHSTELSTGWEVPLKESWLARYLETSVK